MTRSRIAVLLLVSAAIVAWLQLAGIPTAARVWTVVLLVVVPTLMILQGRAIARLEETSRSGKDTVAPGERTAAQGDKTAAPGDQPAAPGEQTAADPAGATDVKSMIVRTDVYVSSIASLWLLLIATLVVAWLSSYSPAILGVVGVGAGRVVLYSVLLTAAGVAVLFAFHAAGVREPAIVHELMPVTTRERLLFIIVSITAGICEEFVFRGFLLHVLADATRSMPIAMLLSSGAFGVAHAYQQPAGALRASLLGLVLAIPVAVDGTIIPSIIAHIAIDIVSGLWLSKRLLRD